MEYKLTYNILPSLNNKGGIIKTDNCLIKIYKMWSVAASTGANKNVNSKLSILFDVHFFDIPEM